MRTLVIALALIGLIACQDLQSLLAYCANPPKTPPKALSDKISLPESYKVSGSVTDWKKASTSLLVESATRDFRVLQRQSREQVAERWIQSLTGEKDMMFINVTTGECKSNATSAELINVPRFANIIGSHTPSVYSIIQGLIEFVKTHNGFVVDDHVEVVGGVNAIKWISCVDGPNATDSKTLLEVRYAGEESIRPAQSPYSNPLLFSIRLAELPTFNSTVALNHVSLELDRYELPVGNEAFVNHGFYCGKIGNDTAPSLPLKPMDEYAAILDYYDYDTNRAEVVEILYSKSRQQFIISGDSFENGVKILNLKADRLKYRNGTDYILHDFKYGYEFTMGRGACESFSPLDVDLADVIRQNDTFGMNSVESLLIGMSLTWDVYQNDSDIFSKQYRTYRAANAKERTIDEVRLTDDGEIHSLAKYDAGSHKLSLSLTISKIPIESSRLNSKAAQLSNCYDSGTFANNTWIVQMKDKKLLDGSQVGLNGLNEAVAASISQNVYPVIPYRIVVFWAENRDNGLSLMLRISEKTETMPAKVGYNFTAELPTVEIIKLLNDAVIAGKMPIVVQKIGGAKEEWMADAKTLKMYTPDSNSGFIGYTGGAMFVLAVFCLLIGVSIGAVGVFVGTRRQRISTLAYQVFE